MTPQHDLLTLVADQPFSACATQWQQLLSTLHLGVAYVPAIQEVLKERRWKVQPNPIAYLRKSAIRRAARMGILDSRPNRRREILASDLHSKAADGEPLNHDDRLGVALHLHDAQSGAGFSGDGDIYHPDYIGNRLPESVLDENLEVKWERVADLAQMDSGERIVLRLRLSGLEREAALAACYTDEDRKILQAAWKRFDRHKDLLKQVLLSGKSLPAQPPSKPVRPAHQIQRSVLPARPHRAKQITPPNDTPGATPQLELIFIQLPHGGMKISFRKCVGEKR